MAVNYVAGEPDAATLAIKQAPPQSKVPSSESAGAQQLVVTGLREGTAGGTSARPSMDARESAGRSGSTGACEITWNQTAHCRAPTRALHLMLRPYYRQGTELTIRHTRGIGIGRS